MDRFEETKLRIKEAVDLVALVESYIPLKRRGRNLVALCPFHPEKTPSFTVVPDSQHYKCFGCGKSGDVFSFVMEREGLDFRAAMELLGERAGVPLDGVFGSGDRERRVQRADAHAALSRVRDFFAATLREPDGLAAREYLESRGMSAAIESFGLGAHPSVPGRLAAFARQARLPLDLLEQAGLIVGRGGSRSREPMLGRVIFPIVDERDRVIAFGGRVLPGQRATPDGYEPPKYLNSPESPFFNKRRHLFGLRQVKESGERRIVVVEGYTDVIACHLAGLTGAVATLGTALTVEHARLLERYATDGVVLLFDGDRAGRQAADRAFRELVASRLPVRIALLPDGCDPADLAGLQPGIDPAVATAGRERLAAIVDGAEDATTVWFRLLRQRLDLTVDANVQRAAEECAAIVARIENLARREALGRSMARHLGISERALHAVRPRRREQNVVAEQSHTDAAAKRDPMRDTEIGWLACLLVEPALVSEARDTVGIGADLAKLLGWLVEGVAEGYVERPRLGSFLLTRCGEDATLRGFVVESLDRATRIKDVRSIFSMLQTGRAVYFAREEARAIRLRLQQAMADGDHALADTLTQEYTEQLKRADVAAR